MSAYEPDIPRIDDTVPAALLHERAEQVCVPDFDWLNQPLVAIVDGLVHVHVRRGRHRRPDTAS